MSYPTRYYAMQRTVQFEIGYNVRTGRCPVCRQRPSGMWPDGVARITCGAEECYRRWLPGRPDTNEQQ
jgi:hypothetical protein